MKKTITYCDICNKDATIQKNISVIFTTHQEDWMASKPYFENSTLDLCVDCIEKSLQWNAIFASGAMWYNKYFFKNKE
jgi:hypothetical protein